MNAFVPKPFEVPALIAAIVRCTSGQAPRAFSPLVISPEHEAPAAVTDSNALQLLDIPKGLMYWRDAVPYRRYLAQFARRYAGMVDALEELLAQQDTVQAAADVHRMRGAAASLAMPKLVAVSTVVEERLRAGDDVGELLPRLRVTLQETIHCVAQYVPPENPPHAPSQVSSANPAAALYGLLDALNSDDPDVIEQVLARMQDALPDEARRQLAMHIEEFDYRAAEADARALLQGLQQPPAHPPEAPAKE